MADSEKKDIEDMMAVLAQMEEKEKYGNIGGREATGRVCKKKPWKKFYIRLKILRISGFRTQSHFKL